LEFGGGSINNHKPFFKNLAPNYFGVKRNILFYAFYTSCKGFESSDKYFFLYHSDNNSCISNSWSLEEDQLIIINHSLKKFGPNFFENRRTSFL